MMSPVTSLKGAMSLSGRRQEALELLRWVVTNGDRTFTEYPLAKSWLTKLESK